MKASLTKKQVVTLKLNENEINTIRIALGIMLYEDCGLEEMYDKQPDELKLLLKVGDSMFNKIDNLIEQ